MAYDNIQSSVDQQTLTRVHWHKIDEGDPDAYTGAVGIQTIRRDSGLYLPAGSTPEQHTVTRRVVRSERLTEPDVDRPVRYSCKCGQQWDGVGDASDVTQCPEAPEPFDGWCNWHDREQVNRMIRSLRRARDRAYGPDA